MESSGVEALLRLGLRDYFQNYEGAYEDRLPNPRTGKNIKEYSEQGIDRATLMEDVEKNTDEEDIKKEKAER